MPLRASRTLHVEPRLPAALEPLRTISRNLWWSWNTDASALFQRLGPQRWAESEHNPVRLLQSVPFEELEEAAADPGFISHLGRVHDDFEAYLERPPVPTAAGAAGPIAYFSLEFALTESLPNYSGGLGVLAGDHLKSASDAGLPLVAVGLLYSEGYFKQVLGPDGWQSEEYQEIDFFAQPLQPVLTEAGSGLEVSVPMEGRTVSLRVLRLDVGRVPLFLLDANIPANSAADRPITARLYGGELEMRMQQEMALGIGGIRALEAMGIHPSVCHMNEGHSALLGLERIRTLMSEAGASFDEAAIPVTAGTVFTTHTPVAAGIDLFPPELVQRYLGHFAETLGLDSRRFMAMGRMNPDDALEPFSMALLGLRLSGYRNGVSKVHAVVARRLWENAWRGLPAEHVPIASITNGVHLPTWVSHDMGDLFDRYIGRQWRETPEHKELWERLENVPDEELWETHESQRRSLVSRARLQHRDSNARRGLAGTEPGGERILDPGVLTIGFARRFAGYKRATLLFRDPARLAQILNHPERPVQLIVAGKAHPRDEPGKQLIREVVEFSREPQFRDRLVVLENHDVEMARGLVQGCDVWLNTPLRPLEASGTSGMKATANGALHMSVLDGWWWEAYRPGIGWAIGRDRSDDDPEVQDALDAESLYDLLEGEVAPLFYDRDGEGVPRQWVERMRHSIAALAPVYNTNRMVLEYAREAYIPGATASHDLQDKDLAQAREIAAWRSRVGQAWESSKVYTIDDDGQPGAESGREVTVDVQVHPGSLEPGALRLDIVYGRAAANGELQDSATAPMRLIQRGEDGLCRFSGAFRPAQSGRVGYVIRLMPTHPGLYDPFAIGLVQWA